VARGCHGKRVATGGDPRCAAIACGAGLSDRGGTVLQQTTTPGLGIGHRAWGPIGPLVAAACVVAVMALVIAQYLPAPGTGSDSSPVYSMAQIQAHLTQQPERWLGRTVRLWALAQPCPTWGSPHSALQCAGWRPVLVDPDDTALDPPLPLVTGSRTPLLGLLRRLPLVGGLLPVQRLVWERPQAYRVRLLRARTPRSCLASSCYQALLLDAAS
jgi:hypothetical protein